MAVKTKKNLVTVTVIGLILASIIIYQAVDLGESSRDSSASNQSDIDGQLVSDADFETLNTKIVRSGIDGHEENLREIKNELALLRSQVATLSSGKGQVFDSFAADHDSHISSVNPEEYDQGKAIEETMKQMDAEIDAQLELLDSTILSEKVDPNWAPSASQSLEDILQSEAMQGFWIEAVECRSTLCQVKFSMDESEGIQESLQNLMGLSSWEGPGFIKIDEDSGKAEIYLAREGYDLPKL